MKKNILKNGIALSRAEQKSINGGGRGKSCETANDCYDFTVEDDGSGCEREWSCSSWRGCVPEELICG